MRRAERPRSIAAVLALLLLLAATVATGSPAAADDNGADSGAAADSTEITLIAINDFHGRIALDDDPGGVNATRFAATIEEIRAARAESATVFLSAGDNVSASLFASAVLDDEPTLQMLRALDLQASAVGNHEFDQGYRDLVDRIIPHGGFPVLGANVYRAGTDEPALQEYALLEVAGRVLGVVGAVTRETATLVSPAGIAEVVFGDPVEAVNRITAQLRNGDPADGEAEIVIAIYHEGAPRGADDQGAAREALDSQLAASPTFRAIVEETDPRVVAILTGHTHQSYAWDALIPGGEDTRPVIQTGAYATHVGVLDLTIDADGRLIGYRQENVLPSQEPLDELIARHPRATAVDRIVTTALEESAAIGEQPVGSIIADITTAYDGEERDDRSAESALGIAVADALLESLREESRGGAQLAVLNPGGLRADLLHTGTDTAGDRDGIVTYAEANAVLPFGNELWTTTTTGAQLIELLNQQWQRDERGDVPSRPYLALGLSSNVTYTYDETLPEGERITGLWLDSQPVGTTDQIRVGAWGFLLSGGDNFRALARGIETRDSGLLDRDAWLGFLRAHPDLAPVTAKSGVGVRGLPDAPVEAGSTIELLVEDLDLTSLGARPNDTITGPGDAQATVAGGVARIHVSVPTDGLIELTAAPSGTVVRVQVEVTGSAGHADRPLDASALGWLVAIGAVGLGLVALICLVLIWSVSAMRGR